MILDGLFMAMIIDCAWLLSLAVTFTAVDWRVRRVETAGTREAMTAGAVGVSAAGATGAAGAAGAGATGAQERPGQWYR